MMYGLNEACSGEEVKKVHTHIRKILMSQVVGGKCEVLCKHFQGSFREAVWGKANKVGSKELSFFK